MKSDTKPLTVLMACDTFYPDVNGAAKFADRLSATLVSKGHSVHVIAPSSSFWDIKTRVEIVENQAITIHRVRSIKVPFHQWFRLTLPFGYKKRLKKIVDKIHPDAIHFQSHFIAGREITKLSGYKNIRIIGTNHVMPENVFDTKSWPNVIEKVIIKPLLKDAKKVFSKATMVTTPTKIAADYIEKSLAISNVQAISCGIDLNKYKPILEKKNTKRIIFVGRLTKEKRVIDLIKAVAILAKKNEFFVDIVGNGDQAKELEALVDELHISDKVFFHSNVSDDELIKLYSRAYVWAIASIAELQSIATLEAMASGLPIVCAKAMALPHLVFEGENGYLFEPKNHKALAEKLSTILNADDDTYRRMQRFSLNEIKKHDIDYTAKRYEELYRGV